MLTGFKEHVNTLPILSIHMKFINRPNDLRDLIRYSASAVKSSLDIH